jgi:thiamine biosynthesis lipoprotein
MGTTWSVVYADPGMVDAGRLQALIEADLEAVNASMSTYIPDSEISRFNGLSATGQGQVETQLSADMATVLETALAVGAQTEGAYDVTVGPLVELWGFGSGPERGALPDESAIAAARDRVGAAALVLDRATRRLTAPAGMQLDLSSVAKGYAVDRLVTLLQEAGVVHMLVEIGGELRAVGERPGGGPWRLAVESPRPTGERFIEALVVRDAAVATSGDYRNYFEIDGRRYSHLVDPRTGFPVDHDLVSVTVIHPQCMVADAWATALTVLGREEALRVAALQGLAVLLVARNGDELALDYTPQFTAYLQRAPAMTTPGAACCDAEH